MRACAFSQVDVFGSVSLDGNPLAVVHGADGLDGSELQSFARWTGLSETTFLLPPTSDEADYRVRIFTPSQELPFAGHPTLGSAYAWLSAGGRPRAYELVVQECGAGLVRVRRDGEQLAFAAPPLTRFEPVDEDWWSDRRWSGPGSKGRPRRRLAGERAAVDRDPAGECRTGVGRSAGRRWAGRVGQRPGRAVPVRVGGGVRGAALCCPASHRPRTR